MAEGYRSRVMTSKQLSREPMTEVHQEALNKHRPTLMTGLQLTARFWATLISLLVLTEYDVQCIKGTGGSDEEQVFDLVRILKRKNDECFINFLRALVMTDQEHLVFLLEGGQVSGSAILPAPQSESYEDVSSSDLKDIQLRIRDSLLRRCDRVETWTWAKEKCYVPMDRIFTDLVWVSSGGQVLDSREKLGNYTEMFKVSGGRAATFVFLLGAAGSGKSTLVQKLAMKWCKLVQRRWLKKSVQISEQEETVFSKFKYVLLIILRYVKKGMKLQDIIQQQYCIKSGAATLLYSKILEFPEDTLIVLEGYDEFVESSSSDITDIAHRKSFREATLLITSRHPPSHHFPDVEDRTYLPDNHVLVKGFSSEDVSKYIHNYFEQIDQSKAESLLVRIKESGELADLSHFPGILLLMCTLWAHETSVPDTITGFYLKFVEYVCGWYESKYVKPTKRAKAGNIINKYHSLLMKIGKLSVSGLEKDKLQLTFMYNEVIKKIGEKAWLLGFLGKRESNMEDGQMVAFPHKTMQEFFTAYYIVNSSRWKRRKLLIKFYGPGTAFVESEMIYTFVNGLGGEAIMEEISKLVQGSVRDLAKLIPALQLSNQAQNMTARLKLPSRVYLEISERYREVVYRRYLSGDCGCVTHLTVWARSNQSVTDSAVLPALARMSRLTELEFGFWSLSVSGLGTLSHNLNTLKIQLTTLDLRGAVLEDVHGAPWTSLMASLPLSLEILTVSFNNITDESTWQLSRRVSQLKQLQVIGMWSCNLSDPGAVLEIIKNCQTLTKFSVYENNLGDGLVEIVNLKPNMAAMMELDLRENGMSDLVIGRIRRQLQKDPTQLKLVLSLSDL